MKERKINPSAPAKQQSLFGKFPDPPTGKFISVYRVSLVKDGNISFGGAQLNNAHEAQAIIRRLIEKRGQPDREQFCILLLNARNTILGMNIVSIGGLSSATVIPREVLKPAILANAAAMILCHNHPSNHLTPSPEDMDLTRRIIQAAKVIGIQVHEHLIISTEDESYFSFAEQGIIKRFYDEIGIN